MIGSVGPKVSSVMHSIVWSTSTSTVGSKKSPGALARGGRRRAPCAPLATASSTWSSTMSICGGNVIAPTSTVPGPAGRPWRSARDLLGDLGDELVVDRLLDVDALDRDAGLAAVLHRVVRRRRWRRARGRRRRSTIIGSLPPSSSDDGRQRLGGPLAMTFLPVARRAGEHDHVDLVDQRARRSRRGRWRPGRRPSGMPHSRRASRPSAATSAA